MRAARKTTSAALRVPSEARAGGRSRQERGVRTEAAILEATLRLLAQRGVQGTSLDAVAEEVGVAKSSVLWHFGSKEELLLRVAEHVFDHVARGPVQEILALPTLAERGEATWRFFSETLHQRPELRRLILYLIFESVEGRPELRERLQQLYRGIRELYESGLRETVRDPGQRRRLAVISVATFDGLFLQWLLDPDSVDLDALHLEFRQTWEQRLGVRTRKAGS
jgi:AcrR family transcriptional regulator